MRKLQLFIFLVFLIPSVLKAQCSGPCVQAVANSTASANTLAVTISSTVSGHLLVVVAGVGGNVTPTLTDSNSDSYTCPAASTEGPSTAYAAICYLANIPSGITSVTMSGMAANSGGLAVAEFKGAVISSPFDQGHANDNGFAGANPQTSGTTAGLTFANDLLVGGFYQFRNVAETFTALGNYFIAVQNTATMSSQVALEFWNNPGSSSGQAATVNVSAPGGSNQVYGLIGAFEMLGVGSLLSGPNIVAGKVVLQ
jgi:hypothetical protein